ncbi:TY-Chap domain-containing protein [Nocardioides sp. NPDC101246]|uniref:TY-Chap domain-containing protein n=1 Tax=Nocardioides sp. NPDC101246 TaxID=3364336 RepID=UPI0037F464D6
MDATQWQERITSELAGLGQQEFVIISEPSPPEPTGFLARLRAKSSRSAAPSRWGQVLCVDGVLSAEFAGTQHIGGSWEAPAEQHEALRAAGWLTPDETDPIAPAPGVPHYWRTVPRAEAELVAGLLVDAFRILGADFDTLTLERNR